MTPTSHWTSSSFFEKKNKRIRLPNVCSCFVVVICANRKKRYMVHFNAFVALLFMSYNCCKHIVTNWHYVGSAICSFQREKKSIVFSDVALFKQRFRNDFWWFSHPPSRYLLLHTCIRLIWFGILHFNATDNFFISNEKSFRDWCNNSELKFNRVRCMDLPTLLLT